MSFFLISSSSKSCIVIYQGMLEVISGSPFSQSD